MRRFQHPSVALRTTARQRISAWLTALILALAVGIVPAPTLLLAAPAAQATEPAIVGYYESEVIPGEGDTPDLIVGLVLYEDGSAEVISSYQNDQDVITEVGTWVDNGDGTLVLTVTGTTDGEYAAPIDLVFNVLDDGTLVAPDAGELTLLPSVLGNSEAILAQIPDEALVFQSDVLPDTSGPGLQLTLAIFDDGSLTMVSDYMAPGEIVVEIGTWDSDADGNLVITLTGQIEDADGTITEYELPLEFVFIVNEDNSLSLVDEGGALFGDQGLTLYPDEATAEIMAAAGEDSLQEEGDEEASEDEASEEITGTVTTTDTTAVTTTDSTTATGTITDTATGTTGIATTGTSTATEEVTTTATSAVTGTGPSGVYISDLLPSNDGSGTFLVTIFHNDGSLLFSTYPLNGDIPVTEVGSWGANVDGTYSITATGTLAEEYDQPFVVEFTMDEDGIVYIASVPLYPLANINLSAAPTLVAEFQSDEIVDTIELAHTLTLAIYDDFSAELITTYTATEGGYTEYGEWAVDEENDQLILTLVRDDTVEYRQPITWIFDISGEGTLVLANDEDGVYGEDGLTLTAIQIDEEAMSGAASEEGAAAEDTEDDAATEEEGTGEEAAAVDGAQLFQSEVLPAASSPGLQLTLGLLDDGSAALDYDYLNDEAIITNIGEWVENEDGTISITLTQGPTGTLTLPVELTLELDDEGNLVIIDASEESLGLVDVVLSPIVLE
jgi:hypothetical protein